MRFLLAFFVMLVGAAAFNMKPSITRAMSKTARFNDSDRRGGAATSPGRNLKPTFDGTFKEAGAPLEKYLLELDNGDKAIVDTATATAISWVHKGVERIANPSSVHRYPTPSTTLRGEFFPEERAKKVSFDRMIFKVEDAGEGIEYRCDVTLRDGSLEYDVTIKNASPNTVNVQHGLEFNLKNARVTDKKGFVESTDNSVTTPKWTIPVGKFKETEFYCKISAN